MDMTGGVVGGCCQVSDTRQRFEARMFVAWTSLVHDGTSKGARHMKLHNVVCVHTHTCILMQDVSYCSVLLLFQGSGSPYINFYFEDRNFAHDRLYH